MAVNNRCGLNIKKCTSSEEVSGPQHVRSECNNTKSYLPVNITSVYPVCADITRHQHVSCNAELDRHQSPEHHNRNSSTFYSSFLTKTTSLCCIQN